MVPLWLQGLDKSRQIGCVLMNPTCFALATHDLNSSSEMSDVTRIRPKAGSSARSAIRHARSPTAHL